MVEYKIRLDSNYDFGTSQTRSKKLDMSCDKDTKVIAFSTEGQEDKLAVVLCNMAGYVEVLKGPQHYVIPK
jgi:hypothetical protein